MKKITALLLATVLCLGAAFGLAAGVVVVFDSHFVFSFCGFLKDAPIISFVAFR